MKNIAVINCINQTGYAFNPLKGGHIPFNCCIEKALKLPDVEKVIILSKEKRQEYDGLNVEVRESWNHKDLLEVLCRVAKGYQDVFYFFGDTPLLDIPLAERLYGNHKKYFAEYTFCDGYPAGLAPEIISVSILPALVKLSGTEPLDDARGEIFTIVQKDINAFDLETEIAPVDQRLLRVRLSCDTRRNTLLVERVLQSGADDEKAICSLLSDKPEILRTLPAYTAVQIFGGCPQSCSYCPYPKINPGLLTDRREINGKLFNKILREVSDFCDDSVIGLSLWGEPSGHPRLIELAEEVCSVPGFSLLLETSGLGLLNHKLENLAQRWGDKITWIVSLDALSGELYSSIRGGGRDEALSAVENLTALFPAGRVFVQAVRMKTNDEELENFFREWKKKTDSVIIQKYDSFSGFLPDLSVADLSPLNRFPCWHLKRDVSVLIDGSVPLCREDVNGSIILGNLETDSLADIWKRGEEYYLLHCGREYPDLCRGCDEYYTYNF